MRAWIRVLFWIGVLSVLVGVLSKLLRIEWPAGFGPIAYIRFAWTCFLLIITYVMVFEKKFSEGEKKGGA